LLLNLLIYFIGKHVLCGKCLKIGRFIIGNQCLCKYNHSKIMSVCVCVCVKVTSRPSKMEHTLGSRVPPMCCTFERLSRMKSLLTALVLLSVCSAQPQPDPAQAKHGNPFYSNYLSQTIINYSSVGLYIYLNTCRASTC